MKKMMFLFIISGLLAAMGPGHCSAAAEEAVAAEDLLFMEIPTVVVASAKEESVQDAPAHTTVITGKEMRERGYRTLYDLLEDLPGMTGNRAVNTADPYDYPKHMGISANVRGTPGGLKLMYNGMVFDAKDGTINLWEERFPIENIERVEYILGPYASLYGRNTYTGVLNVITKSGKKLDGGEVSLLYGKADQFQGTAVFGKKIKSLDISASLFKNYSEQGLNMAQEYPEIYGYDARQGHTFHSPYGNSTVDFPATKASSDWFSPWNNTDAYLRMKHDCGLEYDFQYNHIIVPNMDPKRSPLYYIAPKDAAIDMPMTNTRLKYSHKWSDRIETESEGSYQMWTWHALNMYNRTADRQIKRILKKAENWDGKQAVRARIVDSNEVYMTVALAGTNEWVPEQRYDKWPDYDSPATKKFYKRFFNLSLQDEWQIADPLKLVAGVMYENSNYHADVFVPRFSLVWKPAEPSTLKFLYGGGYITPDMATLADAVLPDGTTLKGYNDIKPMMIQSYDVQWLQKFSERIRTSASVFYTTEDEYTQVIGSKSQRERWGTEIEANALFARDIIKVFTSYSFVEGRSRDIVGSVDTTRNSVLYTPKHQGKIGANVLLWDRNLNLYVHDIVTSRIPNFPNLEDLNGFSVTDLNLGTTDKLSRRWSISIGVRNLLDTKAFVPSSTDGVWENGAAYQTYTINTPIRRRYWTIQVGFKF